ncbi:MAG: hypothetical protein ISR57_03290 [Bacteroidales bacterium]|nr:hypothetical protein [Bacteroidales bacterium]
MFVGQHLFNEKDTELVAAMEFIESLDNYTVQYLPFNELKKHPELLQEAAVVWFHRPDTLGFTAEESDSKVITLLKTYLERSGNLLLTLDGFQYLTLLGLEPTPPSTKFKASIDKGYGRKLGFHAFREHPVFEGLHGGAYIYKPEKDLTVRIHGFFGDTIPAKGKVVAIDWDYIFFRENSKLVVEYDVGAGKVLAVGGYTYYSRPNEQHLHLERFTQNIFDYLIDKQDIDPGFYWDYAAAEILPCPPKLQNRDVLFAAIPESKNWVIPNDPMDFPLREATSNYCEAAGERMVIMGQETGGIEEIWAHPFMALRDFQSGIRSRQGVISASLRYPASDSILWLSTITPEIEIRMDGFIRMYKMKRGILTELVTVDPEKPAGIIHYQYSGTDTLTMHVRFKSNLRLMWPYPATSIGSICYGWDADYHAWLLQDQSRDFNVIVGGNMKPESHHAEQGDGFIIKADFSYQISSEKSLDIVVVAGNEGYTRALDEFDHAIRKPQEIYTRAQTHVKDLFQQSLLVTTPDENFNLGYRWALLGSDRFFVHTPGMGSALVAGYATSRRGWNGVQKVSGRPGYAWYFGRDGQWSGLALLDYGDFEKVRENLEFFLKYQDLSGKVFHEATTSGVIHYDASDATPLFIVLAGKYFRHSGDTAFLQKHWPEIKKAIDFCFSTDTDQDHLIENTNVGHGWVEGGKLFGSHSSFYLTGCWAAALDEGALMAAAMKDPEADNYRRELKILKRIIDSKFWNYSSGFYSYGMNQDGSYRTDPTILPTVPAYFDVLDRDKTRLMLNQYASNAFSTNWGTRIIREDSPRFKPTGYHYGSVWPLFTGWTSLAEYRYGNYIQGFTHIMNNLNVYRNWGYGYVEEVLNGAEYQPSGVCPHQCWSETMVLQPVIEGMLGLDVDASANTIHLSPRLPADWNSLRVEHIRIRDQFLNFSYSRDSITLKWQFASTGDTPINVEFMPVVPPGTQIKWVLVDGKEYPFASFTTSRFITLQLNLLVDDETTVEVEYQGGISILPKVYDPSPGDRAEGLRIIDAYKKGSNYLVDLEGLSGSYDTLSVWTYFPLSETIENATLVSQTDHITKLLVDFETGDDKYMRKTILLPQ